MVFAIQAAGIAGHLGAGLLQGDARFYDKLHNTWEVLRRQHRRTAPVQEITHRLCAVRTPGLSLEPADAGRRRPQRGAHGRPSRKLVYLELQVGAGTSFALI
jgi:hypothetical protein